MSESQPPSDALARAISGDIEAFQTLFSAFHPQLKSYLYRLMADRSDAEDLAHDTFIKSFTNIASYRGDASLKTWVFQVATNLAYTELSKRKRWTPDTKARAKDICMNTPAVLNDVVRVAAASAENAFDMRDHVDHCFTCMSKTLPVEQQVALILKDIYGFTIKEVAQILDRTSDVAKHLVQGARGTMIEIFDHRCALINKEGICHQCSELNGWFNPKQNQQEALNRLDLVKGSAKYDREQLYALRAELVSQIDPLRGPGADLQDVLMRCDRIAMGELPVPS
jgi:RNA polymerase sigma-70 factor, ECF subfamily